MTHSSTCPAYIFRARMVASMRARFVYRQSCSRTDSPVFIAIIMAKSCISRSKSQYCSVILHNSIYAYVKSCLEKLAASGGQDFVSGLYTVETRSLPAFRSQGRRRCSGPAIQAALYGRLPDAPVHTARPGQPLHGANALMRRAPGRAQYSSFVIICSAALPSLGSLSFRNTGTSSNSDNPSTGSQCSVSARPWSENAPSCICRRSSGFIR